MPTRADYLDNSGEHWGSKMDFPLDPDFIEGICLRVNYNMRSRIEVQVKFKLPLPLWTLVARPAIRHKLVQHSPPISIPWQRLMQRRLTIEDHLRLVVIRSGIIRNGE